MKTRNKLAQLIFPTINGTVEDLENKYVARPLKEGAEVTRFAPSPTGFLHTGSLSTAFISKFIARQTGGVFFVRLEDTDTKREIEGSGETLLSQMAAFNVTPDEGYLGNKEKGNYGPYKQSERADIYKTVIKQMISENKAYPCFCSQEDLSNLRTKQEASKVVPGYYGHFAKCSFLSEEEAIAKINHGEPYVIRFKSQGDHKNKIVVNDLIRGKIEIAENDQHIVILKADGLPTYHFAHACDDHFMHTTLVTRGEEWLSSLPLHVELFTTLNFRMPKYAHLPLINKLDGGNKRKLSKRKDPEAAVSYFLELGYPIEALHLYLLSIANSNFEEWWSANRDKDINEFPFSFEKMGLDGALFDLEKVNFFAREFLASLSAKEMVERFISYASYVQDNELKELILNNYDFVQSIMNIERDSVKPRKDYAYFSSIYPSIKFFFANEYNQIIKDKTGENFNEAFNPSLISEILKDCQSGLAYNLGNEEWFASLKLIAKKHGFALNGKEYKANPHLFKGLVSDVAEMLRIAIVTSKKSPNLYEILTILGKEEVDRRLNLVISLLN